MMPTRREVLAGGTAAMLPPSPRPPALRVMTFNVRVPIDTEPDRRWPARAPVAAAMLRRAAPDFVGTQETWRVQADDLVAALPSYAWFGRDRRGGHDGEHMAILHRRDRWRVAAQGDFWFSDTPETPGSMSWGNIYPRMATWGLFERRDGGGRCYVFNTHFPYRAEDRAVRTRCAAMLAARIAALPRDVPVVLTGDFNASATEPAHARLSALLTDARTSAAQIAGPAGTFHDFTGCPGDRIDWVMSRGLKARRCTTLTDHQGPVWPSDHFPVVAEYDLDTMTLP